MERESIVELVRQALGAFRGGLDVSKLATAEISQDARNTELKQALEEGNRASQEWSTRCDQALSEVGGDFKKENPVLKALYEVSKRIRQEAPDEYARDLGIVANSQKALHYWIAAFGTIRTYAQAAGFSSVAEIMETCLQEAKEADEIYTQIAVKIMGVSLDVRNANASQGFEARQ